MIADLAQPCPSCTVSSVPNSQRTVYVQTVIPNQAGVTWSPGGRWIAPLCEPNTVMAFNTGGEYCVPVTPVPTPSATLTPAALQRLRMPALCSDDPATSRRWRIRNPNPYPVPFTWEMRNSPGGQQGTGTAPVAVNGVPSAVILTTATERWIPVIEVAANSRSGFVVNLGTPCDWPSWLEPWREVTS